MHSSIAQREIKKLFRKESDWNGMEWNGMGEEQAQF
jgi:hypothetical protein